MVGSNLEGMDSCTTATLRNKAESVLSDDIWRQYSFDKQDEAWKVPIIDSKDKILDIIGGKFDICYVVPFFPVKSKQFKTNLILTRSVHWPAVSQCS